MKKERQKQRRERRKERERERERERGREGEREVVTNPAQGLRQNKGEDMQRYMKVHEGTERTSHPARREAAVLQGGLHTLPVGREHPEDTAETKTHRRFHHRHRLATTVRAVHGSQSSQAWTHSDPLELQV